MRRIRRWLSTEKPLSHALLVVVAFGLVVAFIAWFLVSWILGQGLPWTSATEDTSRLDVTKLALTVVGGAGAFVALTVAYRRQKDLEDGRFTERFGAAAAQLGAPTPAERLAGVYAMAGVADRYPTFAQQCIDVLCGYLRLPFDPDPSVSHLTSVVRHHQLTADGARTVDRTYDLLPNDREVRDTIVRVIAGHVKKDREIGWHDRDFDLTVATLTTAPFADSEFRGTLDCSHATFSGDAEFRGATFSRDVKFGEATFKRAEFGRATFGGDAGFHGATFSGDARFGGVTFNRNARFGRVAFNRDAEFGAAIFNRYAGFRGVTFNSAEFGRATFSGDAEFGGATFKRAEFGGAVFGGGARFGGATFNRGAVFRAATFDSAEFGGTTFSRYAEFRGATFKRAEFYAASFIGHAEFGEAKFGGRAGFGGATFRSHAEFGEATFSGDVWFLEATFMADAGFCRATFGSGAGFNGATFKRAAGFGGASFSGDAKFNEATFSGRLVRLDGTTLAAEPYEPLPLGPALGLYDQEPASEPA